MHQLLALKERGSRHQAAPHPPPVTPTPQAHFLICFKGTEPLLLWFLVFFFPSFLTHFRADPLTALSSLSPTLLRTENRHVALRRLAPHGPVSKLVQKRKKIFKNLSLFKPGTLLVALTSTEGCSTLGELISSRKRATPPSLSSTLSSFLCVCEADEHLEFNTPLMASSLPCK